MNLVRSHHGSMDAYSEDLRSKRVEAVEQRMKRSEVARAFSVSRSSVKRYVKALCEGRSPTLGRFQTTNPNSMRRLGGSWRRTP
jgi:transposase